jgi:hemolysin III
MILLEPREPMSAWSHALGAIGAVAVTYLLCSRCIRQGRLRTPQDNDLPANDSAYERGKLVALLVFGLSLVICYSASTVYHSAQAAGEPLNRLRRLDHVGIYLLIAGTYTPAAWSLLREAWRRGTLSTVWCLAGMCSLRIWLGGVLPTWVSTLIYLSMGWGVVFCYRELARELGHRTLLPLPLGGAFYSVGALINLAGRPVLLPGAIGAHELFHVFVMAGSACHIVFMLRSIVPATQPVGWLDSAPDPALSPSLLVRQLSNWGFRLLVQPGGSLFQRPHYGGTVVAMPEPDHPSEPAAIIPRARA